jgi:hypothetical protein
LPAHDTTFFRPINYHAFESPDDGGEHGRRDQPEALQETQRAEQSAKQADANRARFGRTWPNALSMNVARDRADDLLDQHRLDGGDAS